jgi:hypothetical protein
MRTAASRPLAFPSPLGGGRLERNRRRAPAEGAAAAVSTGNMAARTAPRALFVSAGTAPMEEREPRQAYVLLVLSRLILAPLWALAATGRVGIAVLAACGRKSAALLPLPARLTPSAATRASRPARGRPSLVITSIDMSHRHRRGHRAKVRQELRHPAAPFVEIKEDIVNGYSGGAAPGVAPTPQKRGPWHPLWTGCQGRLPVWKATPRREFPRHLFHYKHFLNALKVYLMEKLETASVETVGAVL